MNIINISESISTIAGGLQFSVRNFAEALAQEGNNVTLIYGKDQGTVSAIPANSMHKELPLDFIGRGRGRVFHRFRRQLDERKPDLIIQHGMWSPFVAQITSYSKSRNVPFAICPHGMLDPYIWNKNRRLKALALFLYQAKNLKAAKFIRALNNAEAKHVQLVSALPIIVAPNGLDRSEIPDMADVAKSEETICFLGRIDHKKGVLELIEGWQLALKAGEIPANARLRIAGWGSDQEYHDRCAQACGSTNSIEMLPALFGIDKWQFLQSAGGFILPSRGEGLPTTILEAWAAKAVVIMTRECNFDEEVMARTAIETACNPEAIAASLKLYFELTPAQRLAYMNAGTQELNTYTWKSAAQRFLGGVQSAAI